MQNATSCTVVNKSRFKFNVQPNTQIVFYAAVTAIENNVACQLCIFHYRMAGNFRGNQFLRLTGDPRKLNRG